VTRLLTERYSKRAVRLEQSGTFSTISVQIQTIDLCGRRDGFL
jgi:hypothetical protein